jgi:hypothetical protein
MMNELLELPQYDQRLNIYRDDNDYGDLLTMIKYHFDVFCQAEKFLGPYNARQRSQKYYIPPTKEALKEAIRRGGMNDFSYNFFIGSLILFCEKTNGMRALPYPHPCLIYSLQLHKTVFTLEKLEKNEYEIKIPYCNPIKIKNIRNSDKIKFIIVRPRVGKSGTPSTTDWEILLFNKTITYIPNWVDNNMNVNWM